MLTIQHFNAMTALGENLAADIAIRLARAIVERGSAHLVLTGGRTPKSVYENLALHPIDWQRVHLYWGDDRWLPHDHPDSNFALAEKTLLSKISLPPANLHPIPYNGEDIFVDAASYDGVLEDFLYAGRADKRDDNSEPTNLFDITLLGMGDDGHVASLFPAHPLLEERKRLAAALDESIGKPAVPRITLTLPALSRSRCIMFLISGAAKRSILDRILAGDRHANYPAAMVKAEDEIRWYASS